MPLSIKAIIAPANSRRGNKVRQLIAQVRNRRAINYSRAQHNFLRQDYYKHLVMKESANTAKVSIIVPCYNTPKKYFEPLLASVFDQSYQNWELVIVDASSHHRTNTYLANKKNADVRIKYIKTQNEGIAANTNKGISEASGNHIAFLDHDDTLDPNALSECMELFAHEPSTDLVYSDEDKISDDGEEYFEPHFKPDFSLDMLRNVNYITHFVVVKKTLVDTLHGIRRGFDGAQDFDFLLRVVDSNARIAHIPKILYHWRQADGSTAADFSNKQHVTDAGCRALNDHFERRNIKNVKAYAIENRPGFYGAHYKFDKSKLCIFLNLESVKILSIEKEFILSRYQNNKDVIKYEIEVKEGKPSTTSSSNLVVNNAFIPAADSTDIISLFALAQEDGVAGVSPKIVRHGRIFDMGIVQVNGQPKNLFQGANPDKPLSFGSLEWVRNVDKLTGNVTVFNEKDADKNGRFVVWSHAEFIALDPVIHRRSKKSTNFYNENIVDLLEIAENPHSYITDFVEVKK
jgi:glycosyltransferase involved in cell wall biosynthesis